MYKPVLAYRRDLEKLASEGNEEKLLKYMQKNPMSALSKGLAPEMTGIAKQMSDLRKATDTIAGSKYHPGTKKIMTAAEKTAKIR